MPRGIPNRKLQPQTPGDTRQALEKDPEAIAGMGDGEETIDVAGQPISLNDVVLGAYETSGMSVDEWNALEPTRRDELFAVQVSALTELAKSVGSLPKVERPSRAERARPTPVAAKGDRAKRLPHPDDIDPAEIIAPVETSHGWIVPSLPPKMPDQFRR